MKSLIGLVGREVPSEELCRQLYFFADDFQSPVVGAMQVTCADESERECIDAFRQHFCDYLLPRMKFGERSHFRLANLGGRFEWGAVRIAEAHFATPESTKAFKLMVVKINSHVSVEKDASGLRFGRMERYQNDSVYCGALYSLLEGGTQPFHLELQEVFSSEGIDRLAMLRDPNQVSPEQRSLLAAVVNARLQARRALIEIQDLVPTSPTLYFVLPCITLNRKEQDTEILCGIYEADYRSQDAEVSYRGLGDDPSEYKVLDDLGRLRVTDDQVQSERAARDHRKLALEKWRVRQSHDSVSQPEQVDAARPKTRSPRRAAHEAHPELRRALEKTGQKKHHDTSHARPLLKTLLRGLAHFDPVTSAVFCFGEGLAAIHHIYRIDRLSQDISSDQEARRVLDDVHERVDSLSPERARDLIDILAARYTR